MEQMSTCTSLPTFVDEDSDNLQYRADYLSSSYMDLQLPNEQITSQKITFKIVFTQILPIRKTIRRIKLLTISKKDETVLFRAFGKKYKIQIHKKHCLVNFGSHLLRHQYKGWDVANLTISITQ